MAGPRSPQAQDSGLCRKRVFAPARRSRFEGVSRGKGAELKGDYTAKITFEKKHYHKQKSAFTIRICNDRCRT
jgi:hypothetical protein